MAIRRATARDAAFVLRALLAGPNPPNETEESIAAIIEDSDFFFVDTVENSFVRLIPRPDEPDTIVVYWVWTGDLNPALHTPVLGAACRAVRRAHPALGPSLIWGDFPGAGGTDAERKTDSIRQAREHDSWMGAELSDKFADNPRMQRGQSTLDAVIAGVAALVP